ncbi:MAG: hypothetical protein KA110_10440, partial [Acidimicrobiia bacterium]|nr:hypothetical protein [Acidimicrobiia bacterium]
HYGTTHVDDLKCTLDIDDPATDDDQYGCDTNQSAVHQHHRRPNNDEHDNDEHDNRADVDDQHHRSSNDDHNNGSPGRQHR